MRGVPDPAGCDEAAVGPSVAQVQDARRRALSDAAGTGSFLVFFYTQQAAAMAAQCAIHPEREDGAAAAGGRDSDYFTVGGVEAALHARLQP